MEENKIPFTLLTNMVPQPGYLEEDYQVARTKKPAVWEAPVIDIATARAAAGQKSQAA